MARIAEEYPKATPAKHSGADAPRDLNDLFGDAPDKD